MVRQGLRGHDEEGKKVTGTVGITVNLQVSD